METTAAVSSKDSNINRYNCTPASLLMLLTASSKNTNFGCFSKIRAMTTRCCSPPDKTLFQSVTRPSTSSTLPTTATSSGASSAASVAPAAVVQA
mmetsp:Transcript_2888/g.8295  ORF Transcript_2888/g.8295 Transcript_2888/m.8295 type:complete len:95 (-) Transcript_2888:486-770(-)